MRYAWPVFVVCTALLVGTLVLAIFNAAPRADALPELTFRDSAGNRFHLASLHGRLWVASVISRRCLDGCPETLARLADLHDDLPPGVPLVTAVIDTRGRWPQRPKIASSRPGWVFCQGNAMDADDESSIRDLARSHLGFTADALEELRSGTSDVLLTLVDRGGRHRRGATLSTGGNRDGSLSSVLGDAVFVASLDRRPLLHASLNALSAILLTVGLLLIRRGNARFHSICMLLATTTTLTFLGSYLYYHYHVGSMPFRGTGWSRPLYFGVLSTHSVLAALVVPLAATLLYHASRKDFGSHRAIARWTLPVWLYVSVTGVLIYCMLYLWIPDA